MHKVLVNLHFGAPFIIFTLFSLRYFPRHVFSQLWDEHVMLLAISRKEKKNIEIITRKNY